MKALTIIVAVSDNDVIGANGDLPWRIPEDLKRFKRITTGHAIIMGRKTYESIGRPLPNRHNIVVSRNPSLKIEGCDVAPSVEDAIELARRSGDDNPMIIGGASIYEAALPLATTIELTEVHRAVDGDTRFPSFNRALWREIARESKDGYTFVTLARPEA